MTKRDLVSTPKIVLWDLETIPDMEAAMKVWTGLGNYPGLTLKASISSIICFGYKIYGSKKKSASIVNAWDFPKRWNKSINDDYEVCKRAYEILHDADCVVTHNGRRFDWKHLQTRLIKNGLPALPPIAHVDTCQISKAKLYMFNNRLNTLGEFLVDEKKMEHEGWELWVKVSKRDKKAQAKMSAYCKQDVQLLEKVFIKLRKHSKEIPNHNLLTIREEAVCPNCGSDKLRSMGLRYTKTTVNRRFVCRECGSYSTVNRRGELPR